jgi:6-phosphogluconolactonase
VQIYDDAEALARAAHDAILGLANECIREHGRFTLALSGGSTPRLLYSLFERQELDWSKVHLFFGDERCVSPEHAESNYRMVREALLARVSPPAENVHRILAELDPDEAAAQYEEELRRAFGLGPGELPRFDLVLLGLGADGHTASLFPGTLALEERRHLVVANNPGAGGPERVTLTYPVLNAASSIWFLVTGAEKADVAAEVVRGTGEGLALPASGVQPKDGAVIWMLDRAAASSLA